MPAVAEDLPYRTRILANDGRWVLADLDALEGRLADQAVPRPFREFRPDHDSGLDPMDPRQPRGRIDGWLGALDGPQRCEELATGTRVDPAPDLARMPEMTVFVDRNHQRADVLVRPLTFEPANHHQLLFPAKLDLEPRSGSPAGLVDAVATLGNDALELLLPRGLQKRLSIGLDVRGEVHHGVRLERPAQQRLAVLERNVEQ